MNTITIESDIDLFYVPAVSFPEGIKAAFSQLHAIAPPAAGRVYYGVSRPEQGVIAYKAACTELRANEAADLLCKTLVLPRGAYLSVILKDYTKDVQEIGRTFASILSQPGLDPYGYCVEWYLNDTDVNCMVRLKGQ